MRGKVSSREKEKKKRVTVENIEVGDGKTLVLRS